MNTNMRHYILLFIFYRRTVHTEKIPGQKFWPHKTIHDILLHVKCEGMSHEKEWERERQIRRNQQQQLRQQRQQSNSERIMERNWQRKKSKLCRLMWSKKRRNFWLISFQCSAYFSFSFFVWIEYVRYINVYVSVCAAWRSFCLPVVQHRRRRPNPNSNLFFTSCNGISSLVTMLFLMFGVSVCVLFYHFDGTFVSFGVVVAVGWCMLCFLHHYEARRWYWCDMRIIHLFISSQSQSGRGRTSIKYYCIHIFIRKACIPILYT